jgi:membrane-associated protease RseP (regulator of RpoE activity)
MKKTLSVFLLLCMVFSLCAVPALAEAPADAPAAEAAEPADAPAAEAEQAETPAAEPAEAEEPAAGKALLGVSVYEDESAGVLVVDVKPDSPAAKAGFRAGDIIVTMNDAITADSDALVAAAALLEQGAPVSFSLLRKGSLCGVTVLPGDAPELGLIIQQGSAPVGVTVLDVLPGGAAENAGIFSDDVIVGFGGDAIVFVDDLVSAIQSCAPGDAVEIELLRDGGRYTVIAVLDEAVPEEPEAPEAAAAVGAEPALAVTDLPLAVEVREGAKTALLTVAAKGKLDADASFIWYKLGKDGISYPMDSFFLPKPALLGLMVENSYDAEEDVYTSTLCADSITAAAEGTYFCRVLDVNGAERDSSSAELSVR